MPTLIETTVRVTIRQSDNAANASEPATGSVNRNDATGVLPPPKPAAPDDRFMAEDSLKARGRITATPVNLAIVAGNIWAIS